uniref:Transmembrane protein n=1 Tax=Phytophthora ramorum TaxID=164328 RepID=H3GN69_PHYRM
MAARARPPPSADAIAAANAAAATSARPAPASSASNEPSAAFQRAVDAPQSSECDDMWSARSNPSVSSYNSSTREMNHRAIASAFFGPVSTAAEPIAETDEGPEPPVSQRSIGSTMSIDRGNRRRRRRRGTSSNGDGLLRRVFRPRTASESALMTDADEEEEEEGGEEMQHEQKRNLRKQLSLPLDSPNREEETPEERERRRENRALFEELVHLANTHQPVQFDTFRQRSLRKNSRAKSNRGTAQLRRSGSADAHDVEGVSSSEEESSDGDADMDDEVINTELLEVYIAYSKSIGHEPNIQLNPAMIPLGVDRKPRDSYVDQDNSDEDHDESYDHRASYIQERPVVHEHEHFWTGFLGTRYSKRRGCVQFWIWLLVGVGVLLWLGISLSSLQLNEVLHLDAFTAQDVQITEDYTYLHFLEEVDFHLTYTIETPNPEALSANSNSSYFNALLLNEYEFEHYIDGEPFKYIEAGSTLRTTYAYLPHTYIDNTIKETMYFVMQPCYLERNPTADYCQTGQLPTSVYSSEKIYNLDQKKKMAKKGAWEHFNVTYVSVNPMPVACSSSGWLGGSYLLLFLPYVIITLFGLRVFQMVIHCESWQKNLERIYSRELNVPENEVDYWQPMPWDRKVPKTKLCGPCCWRKFRRPFEPFYTWWRHENYFTWIFCPYRNERLSRGERALIVVCSLYITFYVLFIIVMLRDSWGADITIFTSVVLYAILISILPPAGKAVFKELFKLIFRQRRKYFRAKSAGGNLKGFSFRLAFLLQFLVVVLLTLAQAPIFYIWAFRSCLFLKKFMWFGLLAAIMRMSLMGLVQDLLWYVIIKTWGWKDLCPYCTERIKHCDCFNDELLVLAVERVGPKWELIRLMDDLMAKQHHYDQQFELYTSEQLRERWEVLVERAEMHMEKFEKLRAFQEKKRLDAMRNDRVRRSLTSFLSFRGTSDQPESGKHVEGDDDVATHRKSSDADSMTSSTDTRNRDSDIDIHVCSLREKKILELNNKIKLDTFEKHYDSNISEVFHALTHSVQKLRHHGKHKRKTKSKSKGTGLEQIPEEGAHSDSEHEGSRSKTQVGSSGSRSSDGETMWVFDTPAQRLERREEEKLQRKRAFRVLNDYKIESVDATLEPSTPAAPMLSPVLSRQGSTSAISGAAPLSTSRVSQQDPKKRPLLSTRNRPTTPRSEDLVILMPEAQDKHSKDKDKVNLDEMASGCVEDDYNDDDEDEYPSDLERGTRPPRSDFTDQPPPSRSRVYSVTERPQTLFRRVSASASAFAAWALNYDPNVKY